jgi:NhaA family Na+:H+ antiporter
VANPLLEKVMEGLHPYVTFLILPIFAFANAGVSLKGIALTSLADPLTLGILAGLLFGKSLGVMGAVVLAVAFGFARIPQDTRWLHIMGVSVLAGIGFTMSLFIGTLAFSDYSHLIAVRIGVLTASVIAAVGGFLILLRASREGASYPSQA